MFCLHLQSMRHTIKMIGQIIIVDTNKDNIDTRVCKWSSIGISNYHDNINNEVFIKIATYETI